MLSAGVPACGGTDTLDVDPATRAELIALYGDGTSSDGPADGEAAGSGSEAEPSGASAPDPAQGDSADAAEQGETGGDRNAAAALASCDGFAVLSGACAGACHVAGNPFRVTPFADDRDAIAGLLGSASSIAGEACGSMLDAGDPTESLIYRKAADTQGDGCGAAMPAGTTGLEQEQLDCLEAWIGSL